MEKLKIFISNKLCASYKIHIVYIIKQIKNKYNKTIIANLYLIYVSMSDP